MKGIHIFPVFVRTFSCTWLYTVRGELSLFCSRASRRHELWPVPVDIRHSIYRSFQASRTLSANDAVRYFIFPVARALTTFIPASWPLACAPLVNIHPSIARPPRVKRLDNESFVTSLGPYWFIYGLRRVAVELLPRVLYHLLWMDKPVSFPNSEINVVYCPFRIKYSYFSLR